MVGVPASDTSATFSPRSSRAISDGDLRGFVVLVKARCRRRDRVPGEQVSCVPRVFGGDHRHLAQHAQRPRGDVFEVADRRGDHEQRAGHVGWETTRLLYHWRIYGVGPRPSGSETMIASEPLPHFVDDLLGYLHETHPTYATLDGVHTHDDLLEDFSRQAIDSRDARAGRIPAPARRNQPRRADADRASRAPDADARNLQARMFELEEVRTWEKNPAVLRRHPGVEPRRAGAVHLRAGAERARRVLSKLRQTPRLIQAARDNIKDPPGIFVKVGIETMRGALKFIDDELPRAFADVDDMHLLGDLADAQTEASQAVGVYIEYLETEVGAEARASFRLGRDKFEQKLQLEEGLSMPVDRLLAIATRELKATQEAFKALAGRLNGGDPLDAWARTKAEHPAPGELVDERPRAARRAGDVSRAPGDHHAAARRSRSPSRRRPTSTAGRSRACGRPVRSRPSRRAPTTT